MQKFQLEIKGKPKSHIQFIRILRTIGKLSLGKSEEFYLLCGQKASCTLLAGIEHELAQSIANDLLKVGVNVEINKSNITTPMIYASEIEKRYKWGLFRTLRQIVTRHTR